MVKLRLFLIITLSLSLNFLTVFKVSAQQREECCDDSEIEKLQEKYYNSLQASQTRFSDLKDSISSLEDEISSLTKLSEEKDKQLSDITAEYSGLISSLNLPEFDKKFIETENKIDAKSPLPPEIRDAYFNEISSSKAKCLPKYYDRYIAMKSKLEAWEKDLAKTIVKKEEPKNTRYKVVKGDCLWKIAAKNEVYGNPRLWIKIWEANKSGVISAPKGIPKKITNPEYIYPGQVLNIPVLTETEKKITNDKSPIKKKVRKPKPDKEK